ncbi:MAG: hypothetical protein IKQ06_01565 [Bacilli bacterium]|nr:hypothetical protein [Bacilli bacterium]
MIEYNIISEFTYKDKKYLYLLDNEHKYFFVRKNDNNKLEYITLQELVELTNVFIPKDYVLLIEEGKNKKKLKLIPMIFIGTTLFVMTTGCGRMLDNEYNNHISQNEPVQTPYTNSVSTTEEKVEEKAKEDVVDKILEEANKKKENFEVEGLIEGFHMKIVLDSSRLDEVLGYPKEDITYEKIKETINSNSSIPKKFKTMYIDLANNLQREYPNMDLRVWYENLKTMKVLEVEEMEMKVKAVSATAYACYRKDENTIYTVKDYKYEPGTWEYQVIMHEMAHPIRSGFIKKNGEEIRVQFTDKSGDGVIIEEALNSLLALRSYDKSERDIAYQLQSNMVEMMVESLDNYTYQDFVEHNITYFENELNKQNGDDKAIEMLALINLQYKDYHDKNMEVEQKNFYPLYDYIAKMYYRKKINPNMSYDTAKKIRDEYIDRMTYDVPEEYNLDVAHMEAYFDTYCNEAGIRIGRTR